MSDIDEYAGDPAPDSESGRVVISGCSGAGKSSLLEELGRRGHRTVPEAGRQVVREELASGGKGLPWTDPARFVELALSRAIDQYEGQSTAEGPFYFDRSLIDLVAYLTFCGCETPPDIGRLPDTYRYHRTVFMTPPWRDIFTADRERRKTFEQAVAEYRALVGAYRDFGYRICVVPRGSLASRADFVEASVGRSP